MTFLDPMRRFAAALLIASSPAVAAVVTIESNRVDAAVGSLDCGSAKSFRGTAIPATAVLDASNCGLVSIGRVDYGTAGVVTRLSTTAELLRDYEWTNAAVTGAMTFSVDTDTRYALSGFFDTFHLGAAGWSQLEVDLRDETTGTTLFRNFQDSKATAVERFVLGGVGGDRLNQLVGSLSGQLIAGHRYSYSFSVLTSTNLDNPDGDLGAAAFGDVTLTIGLAEPGSLALGLLAVAVGASRRRRTQVQSSARASITIRS